MPTVRRWQGLATIMALVVSAVPLMAQEEEPLAPELLAARKVFVKQTLIDPKIVSRLRSEMGKLDRFEVVATAEEADIIATLGELADSAPTAADSGSSDDGPGDDSPGGAEPASAEELRPTSSVRELENLQLKVVLPDGTEVWTDSVPLGSLTGNASKKLVKRLAERLEEAS